MLKRRIGNEEFIDVIFESLGIRLQCVLLGKKCRTGFDILIIAGKCLILCFDLFVIRFNLGLHSVEIFENGRRSFVEAIFFITVKPRLFICDLGYSDVVFGHFFKIGKHISHQPSVEFFNVFVVVIQLTLA